MGRMAGGNRALAEIYFAKFPNDESLGGHVLTPGFLFHLLV